MTHATRQDLLHLIQSSVDPALKSRLNAHIALCETCAATYRAMDRVEQALASWPPESPSPGFQRSVLKKLGLKEVGSLWWTFLRNFAPVMVAGIVVGLVLAFGSDSTGDAGQFTGNIQRVVAGALADFTSAVGGIIRTRVSPLVTGGSSGMTVVLLFLFAGIGLVDKYIIGPMFKRRNSGWRV